MVKFKGKYQNILILFFVCVANIKAAKNPVSLSLYTQEGKKTDKIFAGKPFKLVVNFNELGPEYFDKVSLQNEESCTILDKSIVQQISRTPSRKSEKKQYVFLLRCDTVGPITLGPVIFEGKRNSLSTGLLSVEAQEPDSQVDDTAPIFLKAQAAQTDVYVGQRVPIEVSFYSRSQTADDFSLFASESTDSLKVIGQSASSMRKEAREKGVYNVITWRVDVAPQKSGTIVMPSMRGLYKEVMGGFLFFGIAEPRNVYSNAIVFKVKPIPKFDGTLDAVGSFTSFFVEVDKTQAEVGQAIVLKFVLTGKTDFSALSSLRLNVPDGFKFFESAKDLTVSGEQETKIFEYIIQPQEEGEFVIPIQEFVFFDPDAKSFKKIQTRPITLSIAPAPPIQNVALNREKEQEEVKQELDVSMFKKFSGYAKSEPILPNWLVLLFAIGALLWGAWPWIIKMIQDFIVRPWRIKNAFVASQKEFNIIRQARQPDKLYSLFIHLFSLRLGVSTTLLNESIMYNALSRAGMSDEYLKKWEKFYKVIEQCYYSPGLKVDDNMFVDGQVWINELKKYI